MSLVTEWPVGGGLVGCDDWRFVVQIARPAEDASLFGQALFGTAVFSDVEWEQVPCRGVSWDRGSNSPGGRPGTGTATLTLDNRSGEWSPWANIYNGPGTLMRVVAFTDEAFIPQFTGEVESWRYGSDALYKESWSTITLSETVGSLGFIDDNAGSLSGSGETGGQRLSRLLAGAFWEHGFYDEAASPITLQSTDMAKNRLAEAHLTADSTDTYFRAHRSGVAMLEAQDPDDHPEYPSPLAARFDSAVFDGGLFSGGDALDWATVRAGSYFYRRFEIRPDHAGQALPDVLGRNICALVYDADSTQPATSDEVVINEARFTHVGGAQQVASDPMSQGRFRRRVLERNDLITQNQANVLTLAQRTVERRANRSLHVGTVELNGRHAQANSNLPGMFIIDIGDPVTFVLPDYRAVTGHVTGVRHDVTALTPAALNWRCSLSIETFEGFVEPALVGGGP